MKHLNTFATGLKRTATALWTNKWWIALFMIGFPIVATVSSVLFLYGMIWIANTFPELLLFVVDHIFWVLGVIIGLCLMFQVYQAGKGE